MPMLYQSIAEKRAADALERIANSLEELVQCLSKNNNQ